MRYVHGSREYEHGGVCVVGVFALAYLNYSTLFTPLIQPPCPVTFDFSQIDDFVYKTYPPLRPTFPHN